VFQVFRTEQIDKVSTCLQMLEDCSDLITPGSKAGAQRSKEFKAEVQTIG
jgi:hypothetical protein